MKPSLELACAAAIAIGGSIVTMQAANALPLAPLDQATAPLVQDVRWGCGPGWHPNPWGRCVPNWRGGPGWRGRSAWGGGHWRGGGWGGPGWRGGHGGWGGGHGGWGGGHGRW